MSIVEVAKVAGLSHSTVSRVINNRPGVSPETAKAVHEAMACVGYHPPAKRRGRRPRDDRGVTTGTIALLMIGTNATFARAPVTAASFHSIEEALASQGFNLIVGQCGDEGRLPPNVADGRIDGLLLHGYPPAPALKAQLEFHPSVWVLSQRSLLGYWGDRVAPDNEAIGRMAAQYLIEQGHRRLAYLHMSATHVGYRARFECFMDTALSAGVEVDVFGETSLPDRGTYKEEFPPEKIEALVKEFVDSRPRATGLFVPRDRLTVRVYRAMRNMGVQPGRDVEVSSCDNEPILEALDPKPTTIDIAATEIGRRAVEQLKWRMDHRTEASRVTINVTPKLVPSPDFVHPGRRNGSPGRTSLNGSSHSSLSTGSMEPTGHS